MFIAQQKIGPQTYTFIVSITFTGVNDLEKIEPNSKGKQVLVYESLIDNLNKRRNQTVILQNKRHQFVNEKCGCFI